MKVTNFPLLALVLVSIVAPVACRSYGPSPIPSSAPSPTTTPSPGQSVTINLTAESLAFDKSSITVPAGASVTIVFNNKDGVSHNFALYESQAATKVIFRGDVISGPKTVNYQFTAPKAPGTYFFRCDIHPAMMMGSFIVQ